MSDERFLRTEMLFGSEAMERLKNARVAVFGVGGVGGYAVEALVRSGVGAVDIIDSDTVALSNLNRQIIATVDTVGRPKVEVTAERIRSINPDCRVTAHRLFFCPENADSFDFSRFDYVVDAIDTVAAKLEIILRAQAAGTPVISSMGTGNKTDPSRLTVADIYDTAVCPLARVMRRELRRRGVGSLRVVYSAEEALTPLPLDRDPARRAVPGSTAFVPPAAGLLIASTVVRDLIGTAPASCRE